MTQATEIDPITLEVVQAYLINTVREMRSIIQRSSYTPTLCETVDFACGIVSSDAELVAMSEDLPLHIFAVAWHVKLAKDLFGDDMHPGDLYLSNDPYTSGPHLNDMLHVRPFFYDGRLSMMIAARVHWLDVGGKSRGSLSGQAREIYEEGIRVPMVKLYNKGVFNEELFETIMANVRNPEERYGDFEATLGALNTAEQRLTELYDRYGADVVEACVDAILDRSEQVVRDAVAELPDGEYYYEEYLENDGMSSRPLALRCKLQIAGDSMKFDFTGSSPQVEGPMNGGPSMAFSGVFVILKSYVEPATPVNGGLMRAVDLISPERSIINAQRPAPVAGYSEVGFLVQSCVIGLLGQIMPGEIGAPPESGANHTFLAGWDEVQRKHWIWYEYAFGGWPASPVNDGHNSLTSYDLGDINTVLPTEKAEQDNPVHTLRSELRIDSGGPGYRRGGLGFLQDVQILDPKGCLLSILGEQAVLPRLGMCGGYPGSLNEFRIVRDGDEFLPGEIPSKVANFPVEESDVLVLRVRGGGGFGDPLEREVERVVNDVATRHVTENQAREAYGVVLRNGGADEAATAKLKAQMKASRVYVKVRAAESDEFDDLQRRICRLSPKTAERLGVADEQFMEYVPAFSSHLKAWAKIDPSIEDGDTPLGPTARQILKMEAGDQVWIRPMLPSV